MAQLAFLGSVHQSAISKLGQMMANNKNALSPG
jgi:ABC-type dipeptide/oligopeptide/nickel transport system permease subunit